MFRKGLLNNFYLKPQAAATALTVSNSANQDSRIESRRVDEKLITTVSNITKPISRDRMQIALFVASAVPPGQSYWNL